MYPIIIDNYQDYSKALENGFFPLSDWRRFNLDSNIREYLQTEIFRLSPGKFDVKKSNDKFYKIAWIISDKCCEECGKDLINYSAVYISHIKTKQAYPELAYDLRNYNVLCAKCHNQWEFSDARHTMKIYRKNRLAFEAMKGI